MKTVIIDDDKMAADTLATLLQAYPDIEVAGKAQCGVDGLRLLAEHTPELLFLDIELPDLSGIDFLERIDHTTCAHCRVVIFSAYDKYMLPAFRNRAFDFLLKPASEDELRTIMQRVYAARKYGAAQATPPRADDKCLLYTNAVDFRLVNLRDIGVFRYNSTLRVWEAVLAGNELPVRLKRTVNSDQLLMASADFVQVHQKYIINMDYLMEVTDNVCHFFPPFDAIDDVKVGRLYRRKLVERFSRL